MGKGLCLTIPMRSVPVGAAKAFPFKNDNNTVPGSWVTAYLRFIYYGIYRRGFRERTGHKRI